VSIVQEHDIPNPLARLVALMVGRNQPLKLFLGLVSDQCLHREVPAV
jgi:hypothetical protein